ncbi:MAG: thioredoxin domain-containing protein [Actinobacteria bacterium]|nr:thioredoxin domain-containing protein [Actinomycetota bacterium]
MNRLARETSPYLRQHAENPVDWYAWGDEAFARAREDDKPVLLSVGYSSCHWCHVMAHESFENAEVAGEMNRAFVNVKVDREERPDVDSIYMQAVQAMTGRGGWPMTVFLTPEGQPFFAGTYFPPEDRHGMPGFRRVIAAIDDAWRTRRDELLEQAGKVHDMLAGDPFATGGGRDDDVSSAVLDRAYEAVRSQFDARFGGFGAAPKFPQAMTIDLLLRTYARNAADEALTMVTTTLDAMAAGGMYDQLGGGFHRYSVDAYWLVPHFEKMLYDQALLTRAYLHAYLVTGEDRYRRVVEETIGYVLRELLHAEGGFFSAEDADSEGEEGRFYVWSQRDVERITGDDAPDVIRHYGVTEGGNFEGANILHSVDRSAAPSPAVERGRAALLAARGERVRPGLDDKVLLGWNALFLRSLTEAAAAFGRGDWLEAARANARFLLRELRTDEGRFLRSWQASAERHPGAGASGRGRHLAYADDYAALLEALLTLAELDEIGWIEDATEVADELLRLFHDPEGGGFFTTGDDAEPLIVRPKELFDNATPSPNSLAADGLIRLAALSGRIGYDAPAFEVLRLVAPLAADHPTAFAYALEAVERATTAPIEVAVVGEPDAADTTALWNRVTGRFLPASIVVRARPERGGAELTPLLNDRELVDDRGTAYVCEYYVCRRPVTSPDALDAQLDDALANRRAAVRRRT